MSTIKATVCDRPIATFHCTLGTGHDGPHANGVVAHEVPVWECWVARYADYSGIWVFASEVEALRYAVGAGMTVVEKFRSGEEVR